MAVSDILEIGKQGLAANRQALQTTSNNIANANTPGYSRQKTVFESLGSSTTGGLILGGGVDASKVIRVHDSFVQNQIVDESRAMGFLKTKAEGLRQIEGSIQNENFRIGDVLNKFFNDVRELSTSPETAALRAGVLNSAEGVASSFRKMNDSLTALRSDLDGRLEFEVNNVNNLTSELAGLNQKIQMAEASGNSANELLDRRDQVVRDLSQKLGLQLSTDDRNSVNLTANGLGILVQGSEAHKLVVQKTPASEEKQAGSFEIFLQDGKGLRNISRAINDGELGGLVYLRDKVVHPTLDHLDRAAFEFAKSVNDIHEQGVGADGKGGRMMFDVMEGPKDASHAIRVSKEIQENPDALAVGLDAGSMGDNRVALRLSQLQNEKMMPTRDMMKLGPEGLPAEHTINESVNNLVGNVATIAQTENDKFEHQTAILNQLETYRQTVSGVSLEEEAVNMMQYQAVFNASAKAMKVGDEIYQTILHIKE